MTERWKRTELGVLVVFSVIVLSAAVNVGFSEHEPGPFRSIAAAFLSIGYAVHSAEWGTRTPRYDTILTVGLLLAGVGVVAWDVVINGGTMSRGDLVEWGLLLLAITVIMSGHIW